jgi:hypothetical protein
MIEIENTEHSGALALKRDARNPGHVLVESHEYGEQEFDVFDLGSFNVAHLITALEVLQSAEGWPPAASIDEAAFRAVGTDISPWLISVKDKRPSFWDRLLGRVEDRS